MASQGDFGGGGGATPRAGGGDLVGCAVGVDEDGVGDVLDDAGAGEGLGGPAGDGVDEGGRDALGGPELAGPEAAGSGDGEGLVGEEPEGVLGGGVGGGRALRDPVEGGEDDEVVCAVEVEPEQAARGTEVDDAAGDGDVAVLVGEDLAGDGQVVERGARRGSGTCR
jgi:hypothetical protein